MSGIPMVTGGMTDSDWADVSNPTQKTSFSSHDCYTERALMIDSRVGWKAPSDVGVTLEPFLYFGLMMLEMSARGGHILIDPVVQPDTKVYGTVIVYEQLYLIPGAGLKAEVELARGLDLGVSCVFSPYVWCKAVDNHSYKRVEYTDTMDRALMVEPEVSLDVALSERLTLSFAVAYRYIWGLIGDEKVQDTGLDGVPNPAPPPPPPPPMPGTTSKYEDQGGASFEALRATLSVAIRL
jgi:outer membrane protease